MWLRFTHTCLVSYSPFSFRNLLFDLSIILMIIIKILVLISDKICLLVNHWRRKEIYLAKGYECSKASEVSSLPETQNGVKIPSANDKLITAVLHFYLFMVLEPTRRLQILVELVIWFNLYLITQVRISFAILQHIVDPHCDSNTCSTCRYFSFHSQIFYLRSKPQEKQKIFR